VNDLNRLERAVNQRANQWKPIFKALADAETTAWDRVKTVLKNSKIDIDNAYYAFGDPWKDEFFRNINLGGFPARFLPHVFLTPFRFGLMRIEMGVLKEEIDYNTFGFWTNVSGDNIEAFWPLPEKMEKSLTLGASVASELRQLSQHIASLPEGVSASDATTEMLAMLYSPVWYPNVALPARLALSLEILLWEHYLANLTEHPGQLMKYYDGRHSDPQWRDFSLVFDRLKEFGWANIAADFSDDLATVAARLNAWCKQQISRPLEITLKFPPGVVAWINYATGKGRTVDFFRTHRLSWSDAGI
jgi:hypothetical protein